MRAASFGCCCPRLQLLWAALVVSMAIGFTIQLLGISFQKRASLSQLLPTLWAPPAKEEVLGGEETRSHPPLCKPRQHLVFLKTHKTGSSTITNILHRFGDARGLRFALPTRYQFSYPNPFQARRVKGWHPSSPPFDILCHHMRFNLPEVQKVMPADSFYFSIVRNPASLAESAFSYYRAVVPAFRHAGSLPEFLAAPQRFYRPGERGNHYARNLLWFDFGLSPPEGPGIAPIKAALEGLQHVFHLVLITEYMDESLVLLREALCWSLEDVVAFRHNLRNPQAVHALKPVDAARLRAWNSLDWHLYAHFNQTFWAQVERFGRAHMAREVALLQKRQTELMQQCLQGGGPLEPGHITDERLRPFQFGQTPILGYALRPGLAPGVQEVCRRLITPELQYKDLLDAKQFPPVLQGNGSRARGVR
ncbi:Galactose-3-O-sulfotransferase 4 [Varanus komodoensis]|uniref:Galactose-3-O-sulfotransferase 4 n=1 Tax=Varanus komodoensis TaxID=61221 RepID=A0A8D2II63_VARKO|nr:galactose-3-O-sulfotransferase 4 [Varanus komodoensis]KAF7235219.1 Galactose-3-O-sulfotransferase 4 [Varanus komodoensis]